MDERFADRRASVRRARRRSRLRRTLLAVLVLLTAGGLVWLEQSGHVAVREIDVVGLERLDASAVLEVADIPPGRSTLRLRGAAVEARVLAMPAVRAVSVRRSGLDRVVIEVTERQPVLVIEHWRTVRLMDRDGVILGDGRLEGLPVVRLATAPPPVGDTFAAHAALANAYRHGHAEHIDVEVARSERGVTVIVTDDGCGLTDGEPGLGMALIARLTRGNFSLDNRDGGTQLIAHLP